jgi:transposase
MASQPWEVSDELWDRLEPLIPRRARRFRYPGRRPLDDRVEQNAQPRQKVNPTHRAYLPCGLIFRSANSHAANVQLDRSTSAAIANER